MLNGVSQGTSTVGTTDANGNFTLGGTQATVGNWSQQWKVGAVPASPTLSYTVITAPQGYTDATAFPTIPNSMTAPDPTPICDDITGQWVEALDSVNSQAWQLQEQTDNSVQGTLSYFSILVDTTQNPPMEQNCGQINYNVSGLATGTSISLNATASGSTTDTCNLVHPTALTETVNLSGRSCSAGTSNFRFNTPPPTSRPAMTLAPGMSAAADATPSGPAQSGTSQWSAATPRFLVQYLAFIPVDHIPGPTSCNGVFPKLYLGDANRGSYRASQWAVVIPGAVRQSVVTPATGETRNYSAGSPAVGANILGNQLLPGLWIGADEDGVRYDCYLWNDTGTADARSLGGGNVTNSSGQAQLNLYGAASNPLEQSLFGTVSIKWNVTIGLNASNSASPTASVDATHTCYPFHMVKVNGKVIYQGVPNKNSTQELTRCLSGAPQVHNVTNYLIVPAN